MSVRKCPHGVNVGPLDDYGVPEDKRVFSTYCAECYRDQTGVYPPDHERGQYTWPTCKPNASGQVVHEFAAAKDGERCLCGEVEWKSLTDA